MQGTIIDKLVSKRIPAASKIAALPHLIVERLAPANGKNLAAPATQPTAMATELGSGAHAVPLTGTLATFTYTGTMTISGTLTATSNQTGTWSGSLRETMTVYEDSSGNGLASEDFSGNVTLHVVNPDGSTKDSTQLLAFTDPFLTLKGGSFSDSEPSYGLGGNLLATLNLTGAFAGSHAVFSENMSIPFTGYVNGAFVSGSVNGMSQLNATMPLVMSGAVANQVTYAAAKVTPFKNIDIVDLDGSAVTVTVTLSNPKNGTLTNLAGGKYALGSGSYTITGSADAVNTALNGLTFDTGASLGGYQHPVNTGFLIKVSDTQGATLINRTSSVSAIQPLSIRGVSAHLSTPITKAATPFRYVTIGDVLSGEVDFITVKLSNPNNGTLTNLGGGFYNTKTGIYAINATAAAATAALHGLKFVPSTTAGAATTSFKIGVSNSAGAFAVNANTTVAVTATAAVHEGVALFSQYIAAGLHRMQDHAAGIAAARELAGVSHLELAASHG